MPLVRDALNSLVVAGASVLGTVISASIVAYGFARLRAPGLNVLFALVLATILLPDTVTIVPSFLVSNSSAGPAHICRSSSPPG